MSEAREEILKKLKKSGVQANEMPDFFEPVFPEIEGPPDKHFETTLEAVSGTVCLCNSLDEFLAQLNFNCPGLIPEKTFCFDPTVQQLLNNLQIGYNHDYQFPEEVEYGFTSCEFLIAETGSIMISSALPGGRKSFIYPPVHIVVSSEKNLVATLGDAYKKIQAKYENNLPSQITLITGPSRTADIEKTLVLGAHGPKKLIVFILKTDVFPL